MTRRADQTELSRLRILGEGGMGIVYEAQEPGLLRTVAVKTVRDRRFAAMLEHEGLVLSALEHPNILALYGVEPGPQLVLRKVQGVSWSTLIRSPHSAPAVTRSEETLAFHVRVLIAVCDAIAHAHSRRILHRDLKPENVMLGEHGEVTVLDWGLAVSLDPEEPHPITKAATLTGVAGTPAYMAPEAASGGPLDERTDVYGLGAILHEMLTGSARNPGADVQSQLSNAVNPVPVVYDPSVDALLGELANRMTAASPDHRPSSPTEVRRELVHWQEFRVSVQLTRKARAQLPLIRQGRAAGAIPLVSRLLGEATSTLRQALDLWPENAPAMDALRAVLVEDFEMNLALGHFEVARETLEELGDPAELLARWSAEHADVEQEALRVAELKKSAAADSFRTDWRRRSGSGVLFTLAIASMCFGLAAVDRFFVPVGYRLVLVAVAFFDLVLLLAGATIAFFGNRRSRRIAMQYVGMGVAVTAHWMGAAWVGLPISVAVAWNCLIAAGLGFGAGATSGDRAATWAALPFAVAFVGITLTEGAVWEQYAICATLSFILWTVLQPISSGD